jgi:hypothetical protein
MAAPFNDKGGVKPTRRRTGNSTRPENSLPLIENLNQFADASRRVNSGVRRQD